MESTNQLLKILDNIAGIGIFVITRKNHEILYFNKHVQKLDPQIKLGDICEKLWKGFCKNCPLHTIGDKESNTTINYDDSFGKVVDITATKIMWKDEIPAYVITVKNHAMEEEELERALGRRQMQIAMSQIYTMVISVNLTKNTYFMVEYEDFGSQCAPPTGVFDDLIKSGAASMHPDYREKFVQKFNRESLLRFYESGETTRYMEHRQMGDDGIYHWTDTRVIRIENPYNDDILHISLSKNIDKEKEREEQMLNARRQELMMEQSLDVAIKEIYDVIYSFNLTSNTIEFAKGRNNYPMIHKEVSSYSELIEESGEKLVHPADQEAYKRLFSLENVRGIFATGERKIYCEIRRKGFDQKYHWVAVYMVAVTEQREGEQRVMAFLSNIDSRKHMKQQYSEFSAGINNFFVECLVLNVTQKNFVMLKNADDRIYIPFSKEVEAARYQEYPRSIPWGGGLSFIREQVHPDDRQELFRFCSLANMYQMRNERIESRVSEFRRKVKDGTYHWMEINIMQIENYVNDDYKVLVSFRDVHKLKCAQLEEELANKRFAIGASAVYEEVFEADLITGKVCKLQCSESGITEIPLTGTYKDTIHYIMDNLVCEACREIYGSRMGAAELREQLSNGQQQVYFEYRRKLQDGSCRWYANQVQLLSADEKNFKVLIGTRNIDDTRQKDEQQKQALQEALMVAENASHAKSDFLSRMSHDIRTPMNAIMGMKVIASENLDNPEKVADCLDKIGVSAQFLLSLINDILDMSKIESGKLDIVNQQFDFRNMIQGIITVIEPQTAKKNQKFQVTVADNVAVHYIGDELRLNQVLMNLLTNAMKYTQEGGEISMTVEQVKVSREYAYIRFRVKDNGIGISEEFQKKLFEPFEQEHVTDGRVFEGSGLGLSITKNLIQLMNGTINLQSKKEEGSCFTVEVPLKLSEQPKKEKEAEKQQLPDDYQFQGERILLVEDNDINMEIAKTLLEMKGLQVEAAENGLEAVNKFRESEEGYYQIILMDIRMPVMDGLTATREIRQLKRADAQTVPIIAMTANAFQEDTQYAESVGMDEYLIKPIDTDILYRKLSQFL